MSAPQAEGWTRRRFLGGLTLAGTGGLLGIRPEVRRGRAAAGDDHTQADAAAEHL